MNDDGSPRFADGTDCFAMHSLADPSRNQCPGGAPIDLEAVLANTSLSFSEVLLLFLFLFLSPLSQSSFPVDEPFLTIMIGELSGSAVEQHERSSVEQEIGVASVCFSPLPLSHRPLILFLFFSLPFVANIFLYL